jgi:hypothetical protein
VQRVVALRARDGLGVLQLQEPAASKPRE